MDLREEYNQVSDKMDYFQSLSNEDKLKLYNKLNNEEQKELLNILPFQYIKNFINLYPKEERQYIYEKLTDNQLKAIYNTSTTDEKELMIEILEKRQLDLNETLSQSRNNIQSSTNAINRANDSIEQSKINIIQNKDNIKIKKEELKNQKVVLKKLERERKRKLKKVLASKKKLSSPLNRIGIISKHRTNKYLERLNELEKTNQVIDSNKLESAKIQQDINNLNHAIKREEQNIEEQKQKKQDEYININKNVSKIEETEYQIKKLSNSEKKILGRKLYKKVVFERECIIVRNKVKNQDQTSETSKIEKNNDSDVEVTKPQKNNTEDMVNNIVNNTNKLQEIGVNFYPPANQIGSVQGPELLSNPITQLSQEQLVLMLYTMTALYNYNLQQMMIQQQQQNLQEGHTRTLNKSSGIINLTLLASITFFVISLLLFILK